MRTSASSASTLSSGADPACRPRTSDARRAAASARVRAAQPSGPTGAPLVLKAQGGLDVQHQPGGTQVRWHVQRCGVARHLRPRGFETDSNCPPSPAHSTRCSRPVTRIRPRPWRRARCHACTMSGSWRALVPDQHHRKHQRHITAHRAAPQRRWLDDVGVGDVAELLAQGRLARRCLEQRGVRAR